MAETTQTTNWTVLDGNLFGGNFTLPYGRPDTRPRYRVKEKIIVKGYENEITIPYKGKSLEKVFDKGSIVVGQTKNIGGQNIFSVIETSTENTFDKDTKQPFVGRVEFALDPSKLEIFDAKTEAQKQIEEALKQANVKAPTKEVLSQDKEDNFYRSLGFTTSGMIKPKVKGRFFVAVVLVAGYFAYKKFKK
jgi:hypothetical protein